MKKTRFVGGFVFWLSTIHKATIDAITKFAMTYEQQRSLLEQDGQISEAEQMRVEQEEAAKEAKVEACRVLIEQYVNQYGEDFIKKLLSLLEEESFEEFFVDQAATENLKAVTLDPQLEQKERLSPKSRADRASGCLIPLEAIKEIAEKKRFITDYEKEIARE